jgi:hypothetical protein
MQTLQSRAVDKRISRYGLQWVAIEVKIMKGLDYWMLKYRR